MSDTIVHTPATQGNQDTGAATGAVTTAADLTQTADQKAAATSVVTDLGKPAAEDGSIITDLGKQPVTDPAKNADGTDKTAEQIAAEAKAKADTEAAKAVPEKYEIKFGDLDADPAVMEKFTPLAKELGLTQDAAQKLATFHAEQMATATAAQTSALDASIKSLKDQWSAATRADPEFGHMAGGKTFEENGAFIAKGLASFGTPALNKALIDSGMGNHPEIARYFYRVGKAVSEDTIRVGGGVGGSGAPKDVARLLFPTMKQ